MAAIAKIFGGGGDVVAAPAITSPPVMPTPDDAAVKAAKRRSIAEQIRRRGRASTILESNQTETLGG